MPLSLNSLKVANTVVGSYHRIGANATPLALKENVNEQIESAI